MNKHAENILIDRFREALDYTNYHTKRDELGKVVKEINNNKSNLDIEYIDESINRNGDDIRVCSECGNTMIEGYVIEGGVEWYCTDECLEKNLSREEFNELYDDGEGDSYWTEWN